MHYDKITLQLQFLNLKLWRYELSNLLNWVFCYLFPIYSLEKFMGFQLLVTLGTITQSLLILFYQKLLNKILKSFFILTYLSTLLLVKNFDLSIWNFSPNHSFTFVKEWGLFMQHLIKDASKGPKIRFRSALIFVEQLRSHVTWINQNLPSCPYKGVTSLTNGCWCLILFCNFRRF